MIRIPLAQPVAAVDLGDARPAELHSPEPGTVSLIRRGVTVTEDGATTVVDRVRVDTDVADEIRHARLLEAAGYPAERIAAMRAACLAALPRPLMRLMRTEGGGARIVLLDSDGDDGASVLMTLDALRAQADTALAMADRDPERGPELLATAVALDHAVAALR
ncbi:Uncharacterised protein (plasmid) [Tsukamurella tyrosinosolvens]|uniref:Uncharacterized protein n=1 Tax=Tsukamurella tyrosinosolvens TaxID=57704 RepID=A0A1H4WIE6_TSUTY|nr:hypothetical protein AXK58_24040 [Tsukamurella tyrosinosolvens]SEC93067.1 hypothetical protein SAMN04489793_3571 [Tsukamurella tyrosinosolvens]VEH89369.1 Uncharacterised protein [Tsukamurella tyrosinosolvens]